MHLQSHCPYLVTTPKLLWNFARLALLFLSSSMSVDVSLLEPFRGALALGSPKLKIEARVDAQLSLHLATLNYDLPIIADVYREFRGGNMEPGT